MTPEIKPPVLRIGHIGSCLSSLPIAHLTSQYNCTEVFSVHNNRSDQLVDFFFDRSRKQIPYKWLTDFLKPQQADRQAIDAVLKNQYEPFIGFEGGLAGRHSADSTFKSSVIDSKVDIILLDNFMDTVSKLIRLKENPEDYGDVFFPWHMYENQEQIGATFDYTEYLSPKESARLWHHIGQCLKAAHPDAIIYHICWSHSTSRDNPERLSRILGFYEEYIKLAKGDGIRVIPPLDVPEALTAGPDDWYHLHRSVYSALAGHIYLDAIGAFEMKIDSYDPTHQATWE